jgi:hypothetical protein
MMAFNCETQPHTGYGRAGHEDFYRNEKLLTEKLSNDVLRNVIRPSRAKLRAADTRFRLDDLLVSGMLERTLHPLGQRYVVGFLHVAHRGGEDDTAKAGRPHHCAITKVFDCDREEKFLWGCHSTSWNSRI